MNGNLKSQITLHIIVFIWGFTGILGKILSISSLEIAWYRMGMAFLIILPYVYFFRKYKILTTPKNIFFYLITGGIVLNHWFFFFEAIKVSTVSVGIICMGTSTFFTALIEPLFFKRKVQYQEVLLGLVATLGMVIIFGVVPVQYHWGIIYGLIASVSAATFTVINGYFINDQAQKASVITLWEMLGGFAGATIIFAFSGQFQPGFFTISMQDWLGVVFIGTVCTAIAFIVSIEVMKYMTPFTVSITINLEPVYTILLALLIFGDEEHLSNGFYLGALLILAAVFTNAYLKKKQRKKANTTT